jgi:hypothetical protein
VPFKLFFIIFLDAVPFLVSIGLTLFYLFFGLKKLKHAKTWSDLFKEEES